METMQEFFQSLTTRATVSYESGTGFNRTKHTGKVTGISVVKGGYRIEMFDTNLLKVVTFVFVPADMLRAPSWTLIDTSV